MAHLPWECWSRGLGGGPMPLWPACLTVRPFSWLKRLSSLMLFSCMLSMGCGGIQIRHNSNPPYSTDHIRSHNKAVMTEVKLLHRQNIFMLNNYQNSQ